MDEIQKNIQELGDSMYGRKESSSTISSNGQVPRKMSRDTIPNIDNYRTRYQLESVARSTMLDLYGTSIAGNLNVCSKSHIF